MAEIAISTEDWRTLGRLSSATSSDPRSALLMTTAFRLKSRVQGNLHARFGSGRTVGDRCPDHNLGGVMFILTVFDKSLGGDQSRGSLWSLHPGAPP